MIYAEALSAHALSGRSVGEEEGKGFWHQLFNIQFFFCFVFCPSANSHQSIVNGEVFCSMSSNVKIQGGAYVIGKENMGQRRVKAKKLSIFPMLSNRKIDEKQQKKK